MEIIRNHWTLWDTLKIHVKPASLEMVEIKNKSEIIIHCELDVTVSNIFAYFFKLFAVHRFHSFATILGKVITVWEQ